MAVAARHAGKEEARTLLRKGHMPLHSYAAVSPCVVFASGTAGAWSPDGSFAALVSLDGTATVWDVTLGHEVCSLPHHGMAVRSPAGLAWSGDGARLAPLFSDRVCVWSVQTAQVLRVGCVSQVNCIGWHPRGTHIALGFRSGMVLVWDVETGNVVSRMEGHDEVVNDVTWDPDGCLWQRHQRMAQSVCGRACREES